MRHFKGGPVYRELLRQAKAGVLYVAPAGDERTERAFLHGYETALSDIANGRLKIPSQGSSSQVQALCLRQEQTKGKR